MSTDLKTHSESECTAGGSESLLSLKLKSGLMGDFHRHETAEI